ncbi:hypothetical protein ACP70R_013597 [Stipagrostis hirtigluma subsp. patula]
MADRALPPLPPPSSEPTVSAAFGSPLQPLPLPPARRAPHDTYVVQVRKDQIYRVPPPENAYLVERYRNERAGGGGKSRCAGASPACSPCLLRTLGALLATAVLVAAAVAISVGVLRPGVPSFSVDRLTVNNATRQHRTDYDFFLTAVNPNKMTALWYRDGKARLLHHGTTLASGDMGDPELGGEDATDFSVLLHGAKGGRAPKAVEKGLAGSKAAVTLQLTVEVTVQVHVGALGFGVKRLAVDCEISAAGLRKYVHISSQKCKSRFGN